MASAARKEKRTSPISKTAIVLLVVIKKRKERQKKERDKKVERPKRCRWRYWSNCIRISTKS